MLISFTSEQQTTENGDSVLCCYRFSWQIILDVKIMVLFAAPQPFPQWDWTLFSLLLIYLHIMKCKLFWTPSSDCSDPHKIKLVVLITDSPVEASPIWTPCWLIAMVKLDFQRSQQMSRPAPVLVQSHQLQKRGQVWSTIETDTKLIWTHCAKRGSSPPRPLLQAPLTSMAQCLGCPRRTEPKMNRRTIRYLPVG